MNKYLLDVQRGLVSGAYIATITGRTTLVTNVESDVWIVGGTMTYPAAAALLNISSNSLNDNPAGTGIGSIIIQGLDANFQEIQDRVTLDGVNVVQSNLQFMRVNHMQYLSGNGVAAGDITAIHQGTGLPIARIVRFQGRTQLSQYTVPDGKRGLILQYSQIPSTTLQITTFIAGRLFGSPVFVNQIPTLAIINDYNLQPPAPVGVPVLAISGAGVQNAPIPARSDLKIRAISTAAGPFAVSTIMQLLIEPEE